MMLGVPEMHLTPLFMRQCPKQGGRVHPGGMLEFGVGGRQAVQTEAVLDALGRHGELWTTHPGGKLLAFQDVAQGVPAKR